MFFKRHLSIAALFFLVSTILAWNPLPPQESSPTVIRGVIKNYEKYNKTKVVKLERSNFDDDDPDREARIQSDGTFEIKFHQFDREKYILTPFPNTHIYAYPGDSIRITLDLDHARFTTFEGDTKSYNLLINKFYR